MIRFTIRVLEQNWIHSSVEHHVFNYSVFDYGKKRVGFATAATELEATSTVVEVTQDAEETDSIFV